MSEQCTSEVVSFGMTPKKSHEVDRTSCLVGDITHALGLKQVGGVTYLSISCDNYCCILVQIVRPCGVHNKYGFYSLVMSILLGVFNYLPTIAVNMHQLAILCNG